MAFFSLPEGLGGTLAGHRRAWEGPEGSVIGSPTPLQLLLATSESAAVSVTRVVAHKDGFEFSLDVHLRSPRLDAAYQHPAEAAQLFDGETLAITPGFLRFGIEWPDGSRATNLHSVEMLIDLLSGADEPHSRIQLDDGEPPIAPVLLELGTICAGRTARLTYWAWPLPRVGPLSFVVEWPGHEIPECRREIDAEIVIDASERAIALWA